jgi:hypothetical protein
MHQRTAPTYPRLKWVTREIRTPTGTMAQMVTFRLPWKITRTFRWAVAQVISRGTLSIGTRTTTLTNIRISPQCILPQKWLNSTTDHHRPQNRVSRILLITVRCITSILSTNINSKGNPHLIIRSSSIMMACSPTTQRSPMDRRHRIITMIIHHNSTHKMSGRPVPTICKALLSRILSCKAPSSQAILGMTMGDST